MIFAISFERVDTSFPNFVDDKSISSNNPSKASWDGLPSVDSVSEFIASCKSSISNELFSTFLTISLNKSSGSITNPKLSNISSIKSSLYSSSLKAPL